MKNQPFLFLEKDYRVLEENIKALKNSLKTAGLEAGEIAHQSSETWHDNYGFEEADRERRRLMATLAELGNIYERATVIDSLIQENGISLGSQVIIRNIATKEEIDVLVGSYMVLKKVQSNEFSYAAPLIAPFMGAFIDDVREAEVGGVMLKMQVVSIR